MKKLLLMSLMVLAFSQNVFADKDRGGGKGVFCVDAQGDPSYVGTLDLYEAKVLYKLNIAYDESKSPLEQALAVQERLASGMTTPAGKKVGTAGYSSYIKYYDQEKIVLEDHAVQEVDDTDTILTLPENCKFVQIAVEKQDQLYINGFLWKHLNSTEKAALLVHEAVYAVARKFGIETFNRVRRVVAHGFAGVNFQGTGEGIPKSAWLCSSGPNTPVGTQFFAYQNDQGYLQFQFELLEGHWMIAKTTLTTMLKISPSRMTKVPTETFLFAGLRSEFDSQFSIGYQIGKKGLMLNIIDTVNDLKTEVICSPPEG